jgi:hypothetical protein
MALIILDKLDNNGGFIYTKMRLAFFTLILSALIISAACGGTEPPANSANSAANTADTNTGGTLTSTTPTPAETTNKAPTLTPVVKAYCEAMEKGDEAGLRRVFSSDTIADLEKQMAADGEDNLAEFLSGERVTTANCEARNEEIRGNEAVAELRTEGMPNGAQVLFVKEGNDWKLTTRMPNF